MPETQSSLALQMQPLAPDVHVGKVPVTAADPFDVQVVAVPVAVPHNWVQTPFDPQKPGLQSSVVAHASHIPVNMLQLLVVVQSDLLVQVAKEHTPVDFVHVSIGKQSEFAEQPMQ